jgi:cytochrome c1
MPEPKRSLKQIARRYSGNLAYFKEKHYFRRLRVRVFLGATLAAAVAALVLALAAAWESYAPGRMIVAQIYNPGPVSQGHAGFANDCAQCHRQSNALIQSSIEHSPVDASCVQCHTAHVFHQPNTPRAHSCTACHQEHLGAGPMKPVADANCASCHNNVGLMAESAALGRGLPPSAFDLTPDDGHVHFRAPRPEEGYTAVFASFENGHPPFQVHRDKLKDPNTLKFNHAVHLGEAGMPQLNGRRLDCASCHQPDASGAYMQPISFEKHCQACHSLQFDPRNPDIQLPHGDAAAVRAFLTGLPAAYADKGRRLGLRDEARLRAYVAEQLGALRNDVRSGEELAQKVFFNQGERGPVARIEGMPDEGRARYAGCAYCHEVTGGTSARAEVTPPVTPDRWLSRSQFDHAKHSQMDCAACHQVTQSRETSDILLPEQASCLQCHSTAGGVVASCQTCHGYHAHSGSPGARAWNEAHGGGALKAMMLDTTPAR